MKRKHYLITSLALILIMLLVVSCAPARRPGQYAPTPMPVPRQTRFTPTRVVPVPSPGPITVPRRVPSPSTTVPNTTVPSPGTTVAPQGNMQVRADKIAKDVAKLKEIQSATCVITGNTALVGVQFSKQYQGKLTDKIKKDVDKKVRALDTAITRVEVTADPDLVTRIKDIFKSTKAGKPVSGFTKQINEIINRIKPR